MGPAEPTQEEKLQSQLSQQLNLPGLQDSSAAVDPKPQPPEGKVYIQFFDQDTQFIPRYMNIKYMKATNKQLIMLTTLSTKLLFSLFYQLYI